MLKEKEISEFLTNTEPQTPPSLETHLSRTSISGNSQLIHKIIASNEELIAQQMTTIRDLKNQNIYKENYIKALTIKYNELLLFASQSMEAYNSNSIHSAAQQTKHQSQLVQLTKKEHCKKIESMINKIIDLQQKLSTTKVELAMKSAEVLSYSVKRRKSSSSRGSSPRRKTEVLSKSKKMLEQYFEQTLFDRQSQISQKKVSTQNKTKLQSWNKIIDTYGKSQWKAPLFKQKCSSLVKKFVPKELRNTVWPNLIENRLGMTNSLYIELLDRRQQNWVDEKVKIQIDKDIKRSFYGKTQYQSKTSLITDVCEFLQIFHIFRPDVSYVQGMTYPAIILIPILGKVRAFNLFCNLLLGNSFFRKTFSLEDNFVQTSCRAFELLLKDFQPQVFSKMKQDGIQSEIFLIEWMFTFFSRGFHFETTLKFWDHLLYFEELAVFRMGLSVFEQLGPLILGKSYEQSINVIRDFGRNLDEDRLLQSLSNSKLSQQKLLKILEKSSNLQA